MTDEGLPTGQVVAELAADVPDDDDVGRAIVAVAAGLGRLNESRCELTTAS